jgi:predicted nucleic acid-binding protein
LKVFVPDASVILKWILGEDEENRDSAGSFLRGWLHQEHEFILPSLWFYEVGNVLGLKRPKDAERILGLLLEYELQECPMTRELVRTGLGLMRELKGVTFYDAIYHAVALQVNGILVTADKAYFEKAKGKGRVMLI